MDYADIKKLKAFFSALKESGFKALNLNQIPSFTIVDGQRMPVDKAYCLALLRKLPQFQGDQFKDDNAIIKYFTNPLNRKLILDRFSQAERVELEKFLEVRPGITEEITGQPVEQEAQPTGQETQPAAGEPISTMTGRIPFPGIGGGTTAAARRGTYVVTRPPEAETPGSKLYVADKSGRVVEERTITPTSTIVKKGETPSKIYIADKSGKVVGEHAIPSKAGPPVDAAPKELARGIRGGGTIKLPYQATNAVKNFGSSAQIFIKKGGSRLTSGLADLLRGTAGAGGSFLGGVAGGGGRFFARVGLGGVDRMVLFSNQISRGGLSLAGPSKKVWLWALGLFLVFFVFSLSTSISLPGQETPTSEAAPGVSPGPTYTGGGTGIISCPLNGTVAITNGSKDTGGHCSPSYEKAYGVCTKPGATGYTGRDTAIDVTSADRFVYLPRVQGVDQVKWTVNEAGNVPITEGEGGGISVAAKTTADGKTYRIRFVHLESTNLKIGDLVDPGALVGQYYLSNPYGAHVHITLQEDGAFKPADLYFNLCK